MKPDYELGDEVRVTRNVRNDGTFPGLERGELLIRRGSTGFVRDFGVFLQDQIIYTVHFVDGDRVVGCRQEELIAADVFWLTSLFEYRDRVISKISLAIQGEEVVAPGGSGEIEKVLRDPKTGVSYHVRFPGRTLMVPESCLEADPNFVGELQRQQEALHAQQS